MLNSTDAKLMVLRKHIITHKAVSHPSYPTDVGSNLTRSQYLSMYISVLSWIGDAMLGSSDMKLGVLGDSIITHIVV